MTRATPKSWLSCAQIAKLNLPGLPKGARDISRLAKSEGWAERDGGALVRPRRARGGGFEYHASLLSPAAQIVLQIGGSGVSAPSIGDRLKLERRRLCFSLDRLARAVSVSRKRWRCWEQDAGVPTFAALSAFAELGADLVYVVTGVRAPNECVARLEKARPAVRAALARMHPLPRRRFLLSLLAEEIDG